MTTEKAYVADLELLNLGWNLGSCCFLSASIVRPAGQKMLLFKGYRSTWDMFSVERVADKTQIIWLQAFLVVWFNHLVIWSWNLRFLNILLVSMAVALFLFVRIRWRLLTRGAATPTSWWTSWWRRPTWSTRRRWSTNIWPPEPSPSDVFLCLETSVIICKSYEWKYTKQLMKRTPETF